MRIEPIDPARAPEAIRPLLESMPMHRSVLGTLAHAETLLEPFMRLAGAFLGQLSLSHTLRELVILRVAHLSGCSYEWTQHEPVARRAGFDDEKIAAVQRGGGAALSKTELAVLHFVNDVYRNVHASESTYEAVAKHLEDRQIVEVVMAVGFYHMLARLLETAEAEIEEPPEDFIANATR